jgi:DNA polymerase III alpha subunit
VLLAAREEGYRNLMRLTSRAFLDTPSGRAAAHQVRVLEQACKTA